MDNFLTKAGRSMAVAVRPHGFLGTFSLLFFLSTAVSSAHAVHIKFPCNQVRISGLAPQDPIAHRMGVYHHTSQKYNSRPVFEMDTKAYGPAYLYYEESGASHYWVVGAEVGGSQVQIYVSSVAKRPDKITGLWSAANPAKGNFGPRPNLKLQCDASMAPAPAPAPGPAPAPAPAIAPVKPKGRICDRLDLVSPMAHLGNQISHRLGAYTLQDHEFNGHPVYRRFSPIWGTSILYFNYVSPTKRYWVVGPREGSSDVNLYAASVVGNPSQIGNAWHIADPTNNRFIPSPGMHLTCLDRQGFTAQGEAKVPIRMSITLNDRFVSLDTISVRQAVKVAISLFVSTISVDDIDVSTDTTANLHAYKADCLKSGNSDCSDNSNTVRVKIFASKSHADAVLSRVQSLRFKKKIAKYLAEANPPLQNSQFTVKIAGQSLPDTSSSTPHVIYICAGVFAVVGAALLWPKKPSTTRIYSAIDDIPLDSIKEGKESSAEISAETSEV